MHGFRAVALVALCAACTPAPRVDAGAAPIDDDGGAADAGATLPPLAFAGEAAGGDDAGQRAECRFFGDLVDVVAVEGGVSGTAIGEVFRTVHAGDARYEFQALIAGPATILGVTDGVEARLTGDQPDDAKPFWLALEALPGARTDGGYAGTWDCAPLDLNEPGFVDETLTIEGTWTAAPPDAGP